MAERKKKKNAALGPLFWVAVILLFIVLFLLNRKNIAETLEKTGLNEVFSFGGRNTELVPKDLEQVTDQIKKDPEKEASGKATGEAAAGAAKPADTTKPAGQTGVVPAPAEPQAVAGRQAESAGGAQSTKTAETPAGGAAAKPVAPGTAAQPTAEKTTKPAVTVPTRKASLWFVKIDAEGTVSRIESHRTIPKSDSPMTDALNELFRGTTRAEQDKGLRSLIPQGTKLLSATVKDGVALINVSEEFQFTEYGIEGYLGQLAQVVYTATTFPTVKSVQFLIEGQRREYLGAEGIWIGTPLSRDKF
ncbi:MAG: hypothetical protein EWM51_00955 [Treponema sp.]|nr:MAG: hypothetical protein EWM51_00955 [Treponema sp.]